tara:strand:- start:3746 stop:4471 length:726 start_codon:yes stop_codon:yes gene_type:complete
MKTTLLQIVQSILSDMDSEGVNSISDTIEAQQIASVVEDTYYNIIAARDIPEHTKLMSLTAAGNSAKPTHFSYPTNTKHIERIEYNIGTDADKNYQVIHFMEPMVFLDRMDEAGLRVETFDAGVDIFVNSTKSPTYYTTFDDNYVIMDSYDSTVEAALQNSKVRAFGSTYPTFSQTDTHQPDLDNTMMPLLLAEAKSACFSLFKGGSDPKVEQSARRLKSYIQNDMHKSSRANTKNSYGRK